MKRWLKRAIVAVALAAASAPAAAAGEAGLFLAGEGDGEEGLLWATMYDRDADVTSVAVRSNGQWQREVKSRGQPAAVCGAGGRLHVFYMGGGHKVYSPGATTSQQGTLWPDRWRNWRVRGACPAGAENTDLYLLLAPPGSPAPVSTASTTAAPAENASVGTDAAAESRPAPVGPVILAYRRRAWELLAAVPDWDLPPEAEILMAAMPDGPYVLACDADGTPTAFARFADGGWDALPTPPWGATDGRARWLIAVAQDLLLGGTAPGPAEQASRRQAWLRPIDPATAALGEVRTIQADGKPVQFDEGAAAVSPYGRVLAIAWRQDRSWQVGTFKPADGLVHNVFTISGEEGSDEQYSNWLRWLPVSLTVVVIVGLYYRHRQAVAKPFHLPTSAVPATWVKRMVAFIIDYFPFGAIAGEITGMSQLDMEGLPDMMRRMLAGGVDVTVMKTVLLALGMYTAYAILTERFLGATIAKKILRLRVVGMEGRRPSLGGIVLRNLCKPVELLSPILLVFMLWPLFARYRRRAGDMLADTAVVNFRHVDAASPPEGADEGDGSGDDSAPPPDSDAR